MWYLFNLKDMFIEEIVETLIRVVDAQLFKTVLTEILEPENVKD